VNSRKGRVRTDKEVHSARTHLNVLTPATRPVEIATDTAEEVSRNADVVVVPSAFIGLPPD